MKTLKRFFSFVIVLAICQFSFGQISGTSHDFSGETWASTNKMCFVCHTPHHAMAGVSDAPLWNHELTSVAGYSTYSSPTFDSHGGTTITDPSSSSKLCLSCHDGTVAIENFGGTTTGSSMMPASGIIGSGGDMTKEHPISFEYTQALAIIDGGLHDPTITNSGLGSTITNDMLFANKMECASCHDVHNSLGVPNLLRMANINSELCLTCHDK
ncbi:MAG: cytochrome c3 family protein [Bacteroidales bacterium]|nr:cytochrome c3 family protein [Bacteroidales bacterium]MCF8392018.1 cytochrome c3 family protein [Bacteroidales bacterium]